MVFYSDLGNLFDLHSVAKVYAVLPFYDVKCHVLEGGNEGGRKATPTSISIFDFYGIKTF